MEGVYTKQRKLRDINKNSIYDNPYLHNEWFQAAQILVLRSEHINR